MIEPKFEDFEEDNISDEEIDKAWEDLGYYKDEEEEDEEDGYLH